jgi:hypothetical protein
MRKSLVEDFFDGMNEKLFVLLIIFTQIVFVFQGLNFADSGFDAVFYTRIFTSPATVQYNFMYWFTGILGGSWLLLFPNSGLLGLRLAGVLFTTGSFLIAYTILKKYLHTGPLRLALFLIVLFLATSVKEFNENDVTAFFFMGTVWSLFTGLTKGKNYLLFLAGVFISVNTFSRIPNVFGLVLVLTIWFSGYQNQIPVRLMIYHTFLFILGFLAMSVLMLGLMKWMHHDVIFLKCLKLASPMEGSQDKIHSFFGMLKMLLMQVVEALSIAIVVVVMLWSSSAAWRRLKTDLPASIPFLPVIKYAVLLVLSAVLVYESWKDPDFWFYLFLFYSGISLITGFLIITGRQPKNLRILTSIGCLMLLVMPLGSNLLLITVGKYALWIILPITIDFLLNIRALSSRVIVSENRRQSYEQVIDEKHMAGLRNSGIYLTLIFIVSVTYFYPYSDRENRISMRFLVKNPHVTHIYTTEARARVIDELLAASTKYVKPEDYVLAYDCMPMYYFLTDSKPYMHNSWVSLYDDGAFREELYTSLLETHLCPVVVMQKGSTAAVRATGQLQANDLLRPLEMQYMQQFMKTYQYNLVWENDFFKIYLPNRKSPDLKQYVGL